MAPDRAPADRAHAAAGAARGLLGRIGRSWSALVPAQRLAAYASFALVATMFLPWYSKNVTAIVTQGREQSLATDRDGLSAWTAFSFVEAGALLVAASVLFLLFQRGEGRGFHLPGGDGTIITVAGGWAAFLIFIRLLDQPADETTRTFTATYGLRWGIFFALGSALFLASSGLRLRAAHVVEPPLPDPSRPEARPRARPPAPAGDAPTRVDATLQPTRVEPDHQATRVLPARPSVDPGGQLSFEDPDRPR